MQKSYGTSIVLFTQNTLSLSETSILIARPTQPVRPDPLTSRGPSSKINLLLLTKNKKSKRES